MEQVLAPRFTFTPKNKGPLPDFDYGESGYQQGQINVGFNEERGQYHFEIAGLVEPKSPEASRIVQEDLNEVIAAFVQTKSIAERGMFDQEIPAQDLTQVGMGKIVRERYPDLTPEDQEAVRQHAVAALNLTQKAKGLAMGAVSAEDGEIRGNTALLDGIRQIAMDVRELDIDMIDSINPWQEAYAVLAKSMSESTLKQVQAAILAKRTKITPEEAKDLATRAVRFKKERGRLPSITSADAWEQRLAEGAAAFMRYKEEGRYA